MTPNRADVIRTLHWYTYGTEPKVLTPLDIFELELKVRTERPIGEKLHIVMYSDEEYRQLADWQTRFDRWCKEHDNEDTHEDGQPGQRLHRHG